MSFNRHSLHRRSLAVRFLFFFEVLSKMGIYLPVSISNGRSHVLNCDIKERRRRDIHLIIYVSGSNISLNIMYVLSLGVFYIVDFNLVT